MTHCVFLVGATGRIGTALLAQLAPDHSARRIHVKVGVHSPRSAALVTAQGMEAVDFDLDRSDTFDSALAGAEVIFLLRPYTLKQLMYGKLVADAAQRVGVKHLVTIGAYGRPCTPWSVIGWNFLVEAYVERLGLGFTHLQPNYFMDNVLAQRDANTATLNNRVTVPVSWIAASDIAAVSAAVLRNPTQHAGRVYPLASETADVSEIALMMSEVTGRAHRVAVPPREQMMSRLLAQGREPEYAMALVEYVDAVSAGKVPEIADTFDTVERVTGRAALRFRDFLQSELRTRTGSS